MKRLKPLITLLWLSTIPAWAVDNDLDGVDDARDQCLNTPFGDLADRFGCTKATVFTDTAYDIIAGLNYSDTNYNTLQKATTLTTTLQADIYRGNLSGQILTSYFRSRETDTNAQGWNDTQLAVYLKSQLSPALSIQTGGGIILPTFDSGYHNEATDLFGSLSFKYDIDDSFNLFGGYTYTFVHDKNIPDVVQYHNTHSMTAGVGYATHHNGFVNLAYGESESIYANVQPFRTLSLNAMYPMDTHWFVLGNYRYGLSDSASDHEISLRVGYYF